MNPGNLVKIGPENRGAPSIPMYKGEDYPWNEKQVLRRNEFHFHQGELGLVLRIAGSTPSPYLKILTPRGIGWVEERWVRNHDERR